MSIRINRVYTKTGDAGGTHLVGGHRVSKDDLRIECYGTVDELNATIGLVRLHCGSAVAAELDVILERVQSELFNLGSQLATRAEDIRPTQPIIHPRHIERLEQEIDRMNDDLPSLTSFVLPAGGALTSYLHLCRTVCRRADVPAEFVHSREAVRQPCKVEFKAVEAGLPIVASADNLRGSDVEPSLPAIGSQFTLKANPGHAVQWLEQRCRLMDERAKPGWTTIALLAVPFVKLQLLQQVTNQQMRVRQDERLPVGKGAEYGTTMRRGIPRAATNEQFSNANSRVLR